MLFNLIYVPSMHEILFRWWRSPSTVGVFVSWDRSGDTLQKVSNLVIADLTRLEAGVLPVLGCAINAVYMHMPCELFSNVWIVVCCKHKPVAESSAGITNSIDVPTDLL